MEKDRKQAIIDHQLIQMIRKRLADGEEVVMTVNGRSMLPLLKPNDTILLESVRPDHLKCGDIITIAYDDTLLTHRFWGSPDNLDKLITRGDRQTTFDAPHTCNQLIGRVSQRHRGNLFLKHGIGRLLNDYLKWILTISYKLENLLIKDSDQIQTTTIRHILLRLLQYWTKGVTTSVIRVVDLLLT